jgi:zinc transport system permease protein
MMEGMTALVFDPLFRVPFITGLLLAAVLPLLGTLLMLREEWLAALGLAHLAAASALLGLAVGVPAVIGGTAGALSGGAAKTLLRARGNAAYGFMILIGWAAMLLVAANTAIGDSLGQAMVDGQLYFAGTVDLSAALILAILSTALLPWLSGRLLRARFFPRFEQANQLPAWRWHLCMDLLAAGGMAVGTATLGLMGAFALVFVPAWLAFRLAPGWRWTLLIAALIGIGGYLIAFLLALFLDQPFGPVLVAVLVIVAATATAVPRRFAARHRSVEPGPQPSAVVTARDRG